MKCFSNVRIPPSSQIGLPIILVGIIFYGMCPVSGYAAISGFLNHKDWPQRSKCLADLIMMDSFWNRIFSLIKEVIVEKSDLDWMLTGLQGMH